MSSLGEKIYSLRKAKGISQEDLGFEIGVSRQTISKWESDAMLPNVENLRTLSEVFQVEINYFFTDESEKPRKDETVHTEMVVTSPERLNKPYIKIVLTILFGFVLFILAALTIYFGFNVFSPNIGDSVVADKAISSISFYLTLCSFILISVVEIILVIKIIKK